MKRTLTFLLTISRGNVHAILLEDFQELVPHGGDLALDFVDVVLGDGILFHLAMHG